MQFNHIHMSLSIPALFLTCLFLATLVPLAAASTDWGDLGNGRYQNPIVPGDFSDTDAIRVGDDYYAISSTMQFSPGMVILHSKDVVNWEIIGHAADDLTRISPDLNWNKMNRYGRGIWAGSIRHYKGRFWIYFGTPDEGFFMTSSVSAAGPWEPLTQVWAAAGWDDCCSFCDDDGQVYLVATRFSPDPADGKTYKIHLFKMTPDGKNLVPESDRIIYQAAGSEANKLYKIDGVYFHFFSEVRPEGRVCMMQRTRDLNGTWEERQLNHVDGKVDREPNQGGLLQVSQDKWMFLTHMGHGDWEGRPMCLLPVTWIDDWPIIGEPGEDKIGRMVWSGEVPIKSGPKLSIATSDDFRSRQLKPQWEWNYQPRADKWSLTSRPGWLRLNAFQPIRPEDEHNILLRAANTITQRSYRTSSNSVTVKLDISNMANGQVAGLTHLSTGDWSILGIKQTNDIRTIIYDRGNVTTSLGVVVNSIIWLRSVWDSDGLAQYYYSMDGQSYLPAGDASRLTWSSYRGDRIGLFTYNVLTDSGWIDATDFEYDYASHAK